MKLLMTKLLMMVMMVMMKLLLILMCLVYDDQILYIKEGSMNGTVGSEYEFKFKFEFVSNSITGMNEL